PCAYPIRLFSTDCRPPRGDWHAWDRPAIRRVDGEVRGPSEHGLVRPSPATCFRRQPSRFTLQRMKIFVCAVLAAASAGPILGCDLCSVYAANEARGEIGRGFFVGAAEQFTHFGTI